MKPYQTLGLGGKATSFYGTLDVNGVRVSTGAKSTVQEFSGTEIASVLSHFHGLGWFPLGASETAPTPGGLGEFISQRLQKSSRFASHLAAVLEHEGYLIHDHQGNAVVLKIMKPTFESPRVR